MTDDGESIRFSNPWAFNILKSRLVLVTLIILLVVLWSLKENGACATFSTEGFVGIIWQALIAGYAVVFGIPVAMEINRQQLAAEERADLRSRIAEAEEVFQQFQNDIEENMRIVHNLKVNLSRGEVISQMLNPFFVDTFTKNVIHLVSWEMREDLLHYQYLLHEANRLVEYSQRSVFFVAVVQVAESTLVELEARAGLQLSSRIQNWLMKSFEEKLQRK